jgi:hypothetical protein
MNGARRPSLDKAGFLMEGWRQRRRGSEPKTVLTRTGLLMEGVSRAIRFPVRMENVPKRPARK